MPPSRKYMSSKKNSEVPTNVSRAEIEKKLNEIDEIVNDATSSAADMTKVALVIGVIAIAAIAFYSGRRRALRTKTFITFTKSP